MTPAAFAALLGIATLFGANHVAARVALDSGLDVATAVAARSGATALVVGALVALARVPLQATRRQWRALALIGVLVALQSALLYSAVARIPVGLALVAFNVYPLCAAGAVALLYRQRPPHAVLLAMPVILLGLALALNLPGLAGASFAEMSGGTLLALGAALAFGFVLALTQHEVAALDGRWRSAITMAVVGVLAGTWLAAHGGPHWPQAARGWWALAALCVLYGTAFTVVFTLLPRLGVVGSSPILNVEPVAALLMAWGLLGQRVAPLQWLGALLVVGTVMALGLRRR